MEVVTGMEGRTEQSPISCPAERRTAGTQEWLRGCCKGKGNHSFLQSVRNSTSNSNRLCTGILYSGSPKERWPTQVHKNNETSTDHKWPSHEARPRQGHIQQPCISSGPRCSGGPQSRQQIAAIGNPVLGDRIAQNSTPLPDTGAAARPPKHRKQRSSAKTQHQVLPGVTQPLWDCFLMPLWLGKTNLCTVVRGKT